MSQTISQTILEAQVQHSNLHNIGLVPFSSPLGSLATKTQTSQEREQVAPTEAAQSDAAVRNDISRWQTSVIIGTVTCATMLNSLLSGLLVVGLPTMAREVGLNGDLLLWPASVNA